MATFEASKSNQMKKHFHFIIVTLFTVYIFSSCTNSNSDKFSFAFYNVENLFDTINDPQIRDDDHLPNSRLPWNTKRYNHKLDQLAKVMSSIKEGGFPSAFGISEVENREVIEELINHPLLKKAGYKIIHKDSPDDRGIDVALLYRPTEFTPINTDFIRLNFPGDSTYATRDVLHVFGKTAGGDKIHLFVNHWVSRWGGQEETEPYRIYTAEKLWNITQKIFAKNPSSNIIIAGDLNDNPTDKSLINGLQVLEPKKPLEEERLYNLGSIPFKNGEGSLYYKSWDMFDQIIVSTPLLTGENGMQVSSTQQTVIKHDWMLYHPKKGDPRPSRTSAGKYYGGFSDHLPVYIEINLGTAQDIFTIISISNSWYLSALPVH